MISCLKILATIECTAPVPVPLVGGFKRPHRADPRIDGPNYIGNSQRANGAVRLFEGKPKPIGEPVHVKAFGRCSEKTGRGDGRGLQLEVVLVTDDHPSCRQQT